MAYASSRRRSQAIISDFGQVAGKERILGEGGALANRQECDVAFMSATSELLPIAQGKPLKVFRDEREGPGTSRWNLLPMF